MRHVPLTSHLSLSTPERVALELPIAGVGSRAIAWSIDAAVLFLVGVTLYFAFTVLVPDTLQLVLGLSQLARAAGVAGVLVGLWVYWTALEVQWRGQTIGKRVVGLRVVRRDGGPVGLQDAAIRNLLRIVDFLPACYPVGVISILVDPLHRRLGDIVAGTVLVREERVDLGRYVTGSSSSMARTLDPRSAELLGAFLSRVDSLEPAAAGRVAVGLAARLGVDVTGLEPAEVVSRLRAVGTEERSALAELVGRRRAAWEQLGELLQRERRHRLELAELTLLERLYRRASADLAAVRTTFPGTDVSRHLTQLCGAAYAVIYQPPPLTAAAVGHFFRVTYPAAIRDSRRFIAAAMALMVAGGVVGAATVALHPAGLVTLVDPELRAFFERRELWTDRALEGRTPAEMAAMIFTNNLRVAFTAFALGITFGAGTVVVLVANGLSVGALVAGAGDYGLAGTLLAFIAAHGPLELSLIAIAGAAGLIIGHALVEPGEASRLEWARHRARTSVTLVLGSAPFIVAVGIIEGFVSPGPFFPWPVKLALGIALAGGFWRYALRPQ